VFDDASDSTQTVTLVRKLARRGEKSRRDHRPSGSPNAMGALQFVAEAKDAAARAGRDAGGGAADGRQETLGVQDHAETTA